MTLILQVRTRPSLTVRHARHGSAAQDRALILRFVVQGLEQERADSEPAYRLLVALGNTVRAPLPSACRTLTGS